MTDSYLDKLVSLTKEYTEKVQCLVSNRKFGEGIFGFHDTARADPCHMNYFNTVGQLAADAASADVSSEEAKEIAEFLLKAHAQTKCDDLASWMLITIQQHAIPLIPLLTDEAKEELLTWYTSYVPKLQRLPIQKDVIKALKK